jgi:hypothetical protein
LLAELVRVTSPFVCKLAEEVAAFGVFGCFGGASAFVRVLLVEASEQHGTYFLSSPRGHPTLCTEDLWQRPRNGEIMDW